MAWMVEDGKENEEGNVLRSRFFRANKESVYLFLQHRWFLGSFPLSIILMLP